MSAVDAPVADRLSPEVEAFVDQLGVRTELGRVIDMTRSLFPGDPWHVEIDDDPEVPDDRHLAIVVQTNFPNVDDLVATQWKWHEQLFECCAAPLAPVFRLNTESLT